MATVVLTYLGSTVSLKHTVKESPMHSTKLMFSLKKKAPSVVLFAKFGLQKNEKVDVFGFSHIL